MPTTTSRLAIPVPLSTDPANVPGDMLNLADALDSGANANYSGVAVIVATPGALGGLPAAPIIGTFYSVNSSPPYLLYYSGESTPGTGTAPTGWRLVGQAGSNVANISNTSPGNSAIPGSQPVWAPLDHRHGSLPWSAGQTTSLSGQVAGDGNVNAYARANHFHRDPSLIPVTGQLGTAFPLTGSPQTFLTTANLGVGIWVVHLTASVYNPEGLIVIQAQTGTATATLVGATVGSFENINVTPIYGQVTLTMLVTVTTSGTLVFQGSMPIDTGGTIAVDSRNSAGYVAVPA